MLPTGVYYYSKTDMTNILSLGIVLGKFWLFLDSAINNTFYIFNNHGKYIHFHKCKLHKLYRLDIKSSKDDSIVLSTATVEDKEKKKIGIKLHQG